MALSISFTESEITGRTLVADTVLIVPFHCCSLVAEAILNLICICINTFSCEYKRRRINIEIMISFVSRSERSSCYGIYNFQKVAV